MNRKQLSRVGSALVGATLLLSALVPAATAAPPKWTITSSQQAPYVQSGTAQGFDITITNDGPSNISSLFLLAAKDDTGTSLLTDLPLYITSDWSNQASCDERTTGVLCDFGAVRPRTTIHVSVFYDIPFSHGSNTIYFELNTTGLVLGDNNSHGDAIFSAETVTVLPATEVDRAGKVTTTSDSSLANNQNVGAANPQATKLTGLAPWIPATIEDGATVSFSCPKRECKLKPLGQWSDVNVAGGAPFTSSFAVTITIAKSALPANLDLARVVVYHVTGGSVQIIADACSAVPPASGEPECRTAALDVDGNLVITVYVYRNGGFRGAA